MALPVRTHACIHAYARTHTYLRTLPYTQPSGTLVGARIYARTRMQAHMQTRMRKQAYASAVIAELHSGADGVLSVRLLFKDGSQASAHACNCSRAHARTHICSVVWMPGCFHLSACMRTRARTNCTHRTYTSTRIGGCSTAAGWRAVQQRDRVCRWQVPRCCGSACAMRSSLLCLPCICAWGACVNAPSTGIWAAPSQRLRECVCAFVRACACVYVHAPSSLSIAAVRVRGHACMYVHVPACLQAVCGLACPQACMQAATAINSDAEWCAMCENDRCLCARARACCVCARVRARACVLCVRVHVRVRIRVRVRVHVRTRCIHAYACIRVLV